MRNFYIVDVLTPERVLAKEAPAVSLCVPTAQGQITLLENHAPLVAALSAGILSLFGGPDDADRHFSATWGICKVFGRRVHILSHAGEESHKIDKERAVRSLENAVRLLASRDDLSDEEITKYRNKIERANLRIQLAG